MSKFSHVPAWSIGKANQPKIKTTHYPGPGKYSDGYFKEEQKLRKGLTIPKAEKGLKKKIDNHDIGPGDYYRGYSSLTKNGISFKGGRFQIKKSEEYKKEVGPGKYNLSGNLVDKKRAVSIGKSKRKNLTDFGETGSIGPGTYKNDYTNKNSIGGKFGKSHRKKLRDPETGDVGPGHYTGNGDGLSKKGGVINRQKREFMGIGDALETGDKLGPGYYEEDYDNIIRKNKKSGKGPKIPKGKRGAFKKKKGVPGPGQYYTGREMNHREFLNGGSFPKASREEGTALGPGKNKVPGPGMYGTLRGKKGKKGGGWTFGRESRSGYGKNGNPGPGQYSKQKPRRGMMKKRPKSVGTFGTSQRGFAQKGTKVEDMSHVGPGSYNFHKKPKNDKKKKKGWSMGKQKRGYMKPTTEVPGPGSYGLSSNFGKKGYSFRRNDPYDKTQGPGGKQLYPKNGTIPDVAPYTLPKPGNRKINPIV